MEFQETLISSDIEFHQISNLKKIDYRISTKFDNQNFHQISIIEYQPILIIEFQQIHIKNRI